MATIYTQGTVIRTEAVAAGGVDTAIEQVISLTSNPATLPEIDVTHLTSTAKEFRGGLRDYGTLSGTFWVDPTLTGQALANTMYGNASIRAWDLTPPGSIGVYTFDAYVNQFSSIGNIGVDTYMQSNIGIRLSGDITFT
jgi:hypothetical protein